MNMLIGHTIGQYRIVEQLGEGTMAVVYKAIQPCLDRYVALKLIHPALAATPSFLPRFEREAKILARLEHPQIVHVYDFGEQRGRAYLAMQHIAGGTLQQRLAALRARYERMDLAQAAQVIQHIGAAIDYAHAHGIVHRDIKPSNIMLTTDGRALLSDFGIATIIGSPSEAARSTLGAPAYLAPEQGHPAAVAIGPASDIYSLGVVLYEVVAGRVPFTANTPLALIAKHRDEPVPSPRLFRPNLPVAVERVLLRALAKDPAARYERAGDLAHAFTDAIKHITQLHIPDSDSAAARQARGSRRALVP
jgi:serine/threonine protein kinase